jgi:cellobiose epimerase
VNVLLNRVMLSGGGFSRRAFTADWKPLESDTGEEYGHDLGAVWLLLNLRPKLRAAGIITAGQSTQLFRRAVKTAECTISRGYDATNGGFWATGSAAGVPDTSKKVWWQQAEGMLALYQLYKTTGRLQYLDKLTKTAQWVSLYQRDSVNGEWYWGVDPTTNQPAKYDWPYLNKGLEWKSSYHTGRATLFLATWLIGKAAL